MDGSTYSTFPPTLAPTQAAVATTGLSTGTVVFICMMIILFLLILTGICGCCTNNNLCDRGTKIIQHTQPTDSVRETLPYYDCDIEACPSTTAVCLDNRTVEGHLYGLPSEGFDFIPPQTVTTVTIDIDDHRKPIEAIKCKPFNPWYLGRSESNIVRIGCGRGVVAIRARASILLND